MYSGHILLCCVRGRERNERSKVHLVLVILFCSVKIIHPYTWHLREERIVRGKSGIQCNILHSHFAQVHTKHFRCTHHVYIENLQGKKS